MDPSPPRRDLGRVPGTAELHDDKGQDGGDEGRDDDADDEVGRPLGLQVVPDLLLSLLLRHRVLPRANVSSGSWNGGKSG